MRTSSIYFLLSLFCFLSLSQFALTRSVEKQKKQLLINTPLLNPIVFNSTYYLAAYPDLRASGITTFEQAGAHWLSSGISEGRRGSATFDSKFYLATYSDLTQAFGTNYTAGILHYLSLGISEGRIPCAGCSPLPTPAPTTPAPTVAPAPLPNNRLLHLFVFNATYYMASYPDLRANGITTIGQAASHWLSAGIGEGRRGSPLFDVKFYLTSYPDLSTTLQNNNTAAILHYLTYGIYEGRTPCSGCAPTNSLIIGLWAVDVTTPGRPLIPSATFVFNGITAGTDSSNPSLRYVSVPGLYATASVDVYAPGYLSRTVDLTFNVDNMTASIGLNGTLYTLYLVPTELLTLGNLPLASNGNFVNNLPFNENLNNSAYFANPMVLSGVAAQLSVVNGSRPGPVSLVLPYLPFTRFGTITGRPVSVFAASFFNQTSTSQSPFFLANLPLNYFLPNPPQPSSNFTLISVPDYNRTAERNWYNSVFFTLNAAFLVIRVTPLFQDGKTPYSFPSNGAQINVSFTTDNGAWFNDSQWIANVSRAYFEFPLPFGAKVNNLSVTFSFDLFQPNSNWANTSASPALVPLFGKPPANLISFSWPSPDLENFLVNTTNGQMARNPAKKVYVIRDFLLVSFQPAPTPVPPPNPLLNPLVFDPVYYLSIYSDLVRDGYSTVDGATFHWVMVGLPVQGRTGSRTFNVTFYLSNYADLKTRFGTNYTAATIHFIDTGSKEGRIGCATCTPITTPVPTTLRPTTPSPNPLLNILLFNVTYYAATNTDLARNGIVTASALISHWLTFGLAEGRRASATFDVTFYLKTYADLRSAFGTNNTAAALHFLNFGYFEGRIGCSGCAAYVPPSTLPPTTAPPTTPTTPVPTYNPQLLDPLVFDAAYYLRSYSDLVRQGISSYADATAHWLKFGIPAGRRGSATFDVLFYLSYYPDLLLRFGNDYYAAILNFLNEGVAAGRIGCSTCQPITTSPPTQTPTQSPTPPPTLPPNSLTINVRGGEPWLFVPNATVLLVGPITLFSAVNNDTGSVTFFPTITGVYSLTVSAPGYVTYNGQVSFSFNDTQELTIDLFGFPCNFFFVVFSQNFTGPVTGANIDIVLYGIGVLSIQLQTNGYGMANTSIPLYYGGSAKISKLGFITNSTDISCGSSGSNFTIPIFLVPGKLISIAVRDAFTPGNPFLSDPELIVNGVYDGLTDPSQPGYRFWSVPSFPYTASIWASSRGYTSKVFIRTFTEARPSIIVNLSPIEFTIYLQPAELLLNNTLSPIPADGLYQNNFFSFANQSNIAYVPNPMSVGGTIIRATNPPTYHAVNTDVYVPDLGLTVFAAVVKDVVPTSISPLQVIFSSLNFFDNNAGNGSDIIPVPDFASYPGRYLVYTLPYYLSGGFLVIRVTVLDDTFAPSNFEAGDFLYVKMDVPSSIFTQYSTYNLGNNRFAVFEFPLPFATAVNNLTVGFPVDMYNANVSNWIDYDYFPDRFLPSANFNNPDRYNFQFVPNALLDSFTQLPNGQVARDPTKQLFDVQDYVIVKLPPSMRKRKKQATQT